MERDRPDDDLLPNPWLKFQREFKPVLNQLYWLAMFAVVGCPIIVVILGRVRPWQLFGFITPWMAMAFNTWLIKFDGIAKMRRWRDGAIA